MVYVASSLTGVFEAAAAEWAETAGGAEPVVVVAGGSRALRLQIDAGAPAHLFVSADPADIDGLAVRARFPLATTELGLVEPSEAPRRPAAQTLGTGRLVLGSDSVPVGRYAREALAKAETELGPGFAETVLSRVVSFEPNARLLLTKVAMGEADGALAYRADLPAGLRFSPLPARWRVAGRSELAVLHVRADDFAGFVLGPAGARLLATHGFEPASTVTP